MPCTYDLHSKKARKCDCRQDDCKNNNKIKIQGVLGCIAVDLQVRLRKRRQKSNAVFEFVAAADNLAGVTAEVT